MYKCEYMFSGCFLVVFWLSLWNKINWRMENIFIDEDNKIELKEIINNTLPKEIVAFLNTDGGTIYIGINKNRTVIGVDNMDDSLRVISDIITD